MLDSLPYSSPLTWASLIQLYSYVKYDYGDYHSILILFIEGPTISTKAEGIGGILTGKPLGLRVEDEPLLDFTLNFARHISYDETMSRVCNPFLMQDSVGRVASQRVSLDGQLVRVALPALECTVPNTPY